MLSDGGELGGAVAQVILVHGIAQEQKAADTLEEEWLPDLAGGVRIAGFPDLADQLYRLRGTPNGIDTRMAFYGDLFRSHGQQGLTPADLTAPELALAENIATEYLERAAHRSTDPRTSKPATQELAYLKEGSGEAQGRGAVVRSAINSLSRLRWFAMPAKGLIERFVMRSLSQVTRYLSDDGVREKVLGRVHDLIGPETQIIVGHSLGSVVAFEAAHLLKQPLPLLVTMGSPLGLRTIVYDNVRPHPPTFPPLVQSWVNVADRDDVVAAEPDLTKLFSGSIPEGAVLKGGYTIDNGAKPHCADFYLTTLEVGRSISEILHQA
jgi:hypothetical protein